MKFNFKERLIFQDFYLLKMDDQEYKVLQGGLDGTKRNLHNRGRKWWYGDGWRFNTGGT